MTQEDSAGSKNISSMIYKAFFGDRETQKSQELGDLKNRTFTLILSDNDLIKFQDFCDRLNLVDVNKLDNSKRSNLIKLSFDNDTFILDNSKVSSKLIKDLGDSC